MNAHANQAQREHWNGDESSHWVDHADRYDRQLAPFADALLHQSQLDERQRLLDVGCGCGVTTIAAAQRARDAVGADLSGPMLAVATSRAEAAEVDNVEFIVADAQTHSFVDGGFDRIISRFGVMFFDDPLAAFANLRRALAPEGRLVFVCWRSLEANEWLLVPGLAAAAHVALPDVGGTAGGPGMFSLADPDGTRDLLTRCGFSKVEIEPISPVITLGGGGSLDDSVDFLLGTGIAHALLDPAAPDARAKAIDAVRSALAERFEPKVGVRLSTGAWLVTAER
jgi:SAM-dependent methyltransferase